MAKEGPNGNPEFAFLRVLKAIAASEHEAGLDTLDQADRSLLYHIAMQERSGTAIKVTDLWKDGAFGTLPTVLSRVARLIEQGWVDKEVNPNDARSRVVSTTSQARSFFRNASKAVAGAVGEW